MEYLDIDRNGLVKAIQHVVNPQPKGGQAMGKETENVFKLELTEQELQTVFNSLVERPFREVAALVGKLQGVYRARMDKAENVGDE